MYITNCTLCTNCEKLTVQYQWYTTKCILLTVLYQLYATICKLLTETSNCTLPTALHTLHCQLYTNDCTLPAEHYQTSCTLQNILIHLHTFNRMLPTYYSTTVYTFSGPYCTANWTPYTEHLRITTHYILHTVNYTLYYTNYTRNKVQCTVYNPHCTTPCN